MLDGRRPARMALCASEELLLLALLEIAPRLLWGSGLSVVLVLINGPPRTERDCGT